METSVGTIDRRAVGRVRALAGSWDAVTVALGAAVVLGIVLRFGTVGLQSYHHDEVVTAARVLPGSLGHTLHEVRVSESCPPLYYILAHWWGQVFGFGEAGLRSLSALFGVLTIPVAYLIGAELYGRRAGAITAAIVAVSPMLIWYSQEARAYALLILLCAVSLLFFLRALRTRSTADLIGWGAASALALGTHYFAAGVIAIEAVWILFALGVNRVVLGSLALVVLTGVALLPLALHQINPDHIGWIGGTSLGKRLSQGGGAFVLGETGRIIAEKPQNALVVPFAILAVAGMTMGLGTRRGAIAVGTPLLIGLGCVGLATAAALLGHDYIFSRNLLPALLPICAAVGAGLAASSRRWLAGSMAVVLCGALLVFDIHVARTPALQRPDWGQIAEEMGPPDARRALVMWKLGAIPLNHYIDDGDWVAEGDFRVGEVDIIGRPTARPLPQLIPGFRPAGTAQVGPFVVTRYVARRPDVLGFSYLESLPTGFPENAVVIQNTPEQQERIDAAEEDSP